MVIGAMIVEFHIHDNQSLKGKRKIVKSMIGKVKSRFNVAIAETGANDKWQAIELGVSAVGNDRRFVDSSLANVLSFLDSLYLAELTNSRIEIINV
ncbi:MAG: DUF503 domain-containing protein [Deltaproteobacteria bacterium]|nr:DUF503 domain-containing protein [Deltaproteobacteria bacterium]